LEDKQMTKRSVLMIAVVTLGFTSMMLPTSYAERGSQGLRARKVRGNDARDGGISHNFDGRRARERHWRNDKKLASHAPVHAFVGRLLCYDLPGSECRAFTV
jgi:hypothetical protein